MSRTKERRLIREVYVKDIVVYFYIMAILLILSWIIFGLVVALSNFKWWIMLLIEIPVNYIILRNLAIGIVLMYKAYAPLEVRGRCRFEPTCSTYMIMAIQKYGLIRGVIKGIKRIKRCKPPNGGIDYP